MNKRNTAQAIAAKKFQNKNLSYCIAEPISCNGEIKNHPALGVVANDGADGEGEVLNLLEK